MISTKGRYSIRILLDLAEHRGVGYTPIKDVAARQSISLKYVEKLMPALKNAGLLDSSHGIGGGYRLNRDPEQYDLWEILRVTEGELTSHPSVPSPDPGIPSNYRASPDPGVSYVPVHSARIYCLIPCLSLYPPSGQVCCLTPVRRLFPVFPRSKHLP